MLHILEGTRLVEEARDQLFVQAPLRGQNLHGDGVSVGPVTSLVHFTHGPDCRETDDLVIFNAESL
ncbi:hypothetical protein D187_005341 [Cystobacter fuscus DSM 2262]|uniref:Uncharacterized protein n=1 Tax=Cystobacter fuscus (strain ATCC 25194 / DSM 2262 / NBRC 100088 / M29) TaxID=1242864 RepID=S9PP13_CYSF2|nr:hypothetical protein D187_005341 [Cystobacter fuscus DSM 2262]